LLKAEIGAILRLAIGNCLIEGREARRLDDLAFRIRFAFTALEGALNLNSEIPDFVFGKNLRQQENETRCSGPSGPA
jgi:hypothetical protein